MAKLQSLNSVPGKETIYVDVDDEITSIIDKVQGSKGKVIALVLPKRATVLQSIVNMKLLKRSAENASKNLVLITSEAGLMPLAGAVGLHVAATPSSKPTVPVAPDAVSDEPEEVDQPLDITDGSVADNDEDFDSKSSASKTVGELAGAGAVAKAAATEDVDETIDMTDDELLTPDEAAAPLVSNAAKTKKNGKLKVPNFDSFRKKLALGLGLVLLLIVGLIYAMVAMPKASVAIKTDSETITTNANLTLDTNTKTLNEDSKIVPAVAQSQQKTATQQVAATGQLNNGTKATGKAKFSVQKCTQPIGVAPSDISSGSSISSGGKTYILQEAVSFSFSGFSQGGTCANYTSNNADIQALKGGTDYNTATSATFTSNSGASGTGSASGGTDDIKKVVAQADIDNATSKMKAEDSSSVKEQLNSGLAAKGLLAVPVTFVAGDAQVTTSAKAGDVADTVTVTSVTPYTMLGVNKSDIKKIIEKNVNTQLEKGKQVILSDGVASADFSTQTAATATGAGVAMEAKSLVGPQIDIAKLKTQLAGKKSGEVKALIKQTPGVTDVQVQLSPFWVETVPKGADKVTITIDKAKN